MTASQSEQTMLSEPFDHIIRKLCVNILSEPDPVKLPGLIIEHIQETFPVEWSTLWLTEQKDGVNHLRLAAAAPKACPLMTAENGQPAVYAFGEGLTGDIAEKMETVNITKQKDFEKYQHAYKYDLVMYERDKAGDKCRSVLGVPLRLRTPLPDTKDALPDECEWRVVGVLKLENLVPTRNHPAKFFTPRDQEIIEGYAAVIAVALEKAQMRAASMRIGQGLLDVTKGLLENLGERPNFEKVVEQTAKAISAKACSLWLRRGQELHIDAAHGYPGGSDDIPYYSLVKKPDVQKTGLTVYVAETGKPLNLTTEKEIRDHSAWKGVNDERMWQKPQGQACYSLVIIPLIDHETKDVKGVFKIENKERTRYQLLSYFTREDQDLLETLGNSISLSLIISERVERLRRLERIVGDVRVLDGMDIALFFILTGLTHGGGLQYNRALAFLKDDSRDDQFTCRFALSQVEPADWEREMKRPLATESLDMDQLLDRFKREKKASKRDRKINEEWRGKKVLLSDGKNQVIARFANEIEDSLSQKGNSEEVSARKYLSGSLNETDILEGFAFGDFALVPIVVDRRLIGVIYVDNRFTGNRINQFECQALDLFAGMAGSVIQASKAPAILRYEINEAWKAFSGTAAHRLGAETSIIDNEINLYIRPELVAGKKGGGGQISINAKTINESIAVIKSSIERLRQAGRDYQQLTSDHGAVEQIELISLINNIIVKTGSGLRGLTVILDGPPELIINARKRPTAYMFEEFLINAWKETEAGRTDGVSNGRREINVLIQLRQNGACVECLVCDNGDGIPPRIHKTLFKKLGKGRHGGTGLGLYIVAQFLHDNDGDITLVDDNKPSGYKGACFRILLPMSGPSSEEVSQ